MDDMLDKYDFKNTNKKTRNALEKEIEAWGYDESKDRIDAKTLVGALSVFQKKVCVADFPTLESDAGQMAITAFNLVTDCMYRLIDEGRAQASTFQKVLLEFLLALVDAGPGTTHCQLVEEVFKVSLAEFGEYCQSMKGESVRRLLTVCRREFTPGKEKITYEQYADKAYDAMRCIFNDGFSSSQYTEYREDFLEVFLYYKYDFLDSPPGQRKLMLQMAEWLDHNFDGRPLRGIKEKAPYTKYLDRLKVIISVKSFPQDDKVAASVADDLTTLFDDVSAAGNFRSLYKEITDFAAYLFREKAGKPVHQLVKAIGSFFYDLDVSHVMNNGKMFEYMCKSLTSILKETTDHSLLEPPFANAIVSEVLVKSMSNSPEHASLMVDLILQLITIPFFSTVSGAEEAVRVKGKQLNWKDRLGSARAVFAAYGKVQLPRSPTTDLIDKYRYFNQSFINALQSARMIQKLEGDIVRFALGVLERKVHIFYDVACEAAGLLEFNAKKNKKLIVEILRRVGPLLEDDSHPWTSCGDLSRLTSVLVCHSVEGIKSGKLLDENEYRLMVSMSLTLMGKDFIHPDTGELGNLHWGLIRSVIPAVLQLLGEINKLQWCQSMLGGLIDMLTHEESDVQEFAGWEVEVVCRESANLFSPYLDKLVNAFLEVEKSSLMAAISNIYKSNPDPVHARLEELMKYHNDTDTAIKMHAMQLYLAVATHHPEQLTKKHLLDLWAHAKKDKGNAGVILMAMTEVAKSKPNQIEQILPQFMDTKGLAPFVLPTFLNVLKETGMRSKKHAEEITDYFAKMLDGPEEQTKMLCLLDGMKNVGGQHLPFLAKHKQLLERVQKKARIQYTRDGCSHLIDIIEGRSLVGLSEDVQNTKKEVKVLDKKVVKTSTKVKAVSKEVTQQKKDIKTVKKEVKTQVKKTEAVKEKLDTTVAKVEEIDSKTLSHAPFWARDVSKLLNPKGEHDWRLLSSRLGYSNDDIRGWAQQHDPCMSMLNEWYATRKTSEATFAILTALQEMSRMDAAIIVENGMKMAEIVVEEEEFDYPEPPEVFLSYQWGIQNEVKLLKQHLEKAGFTCWMDIGQMGGGDKLFDKIDKGIRGAKLIISCVNEKYAKSPNCNREVNLSVSLGRPIIPLLMEKQTWPPAGSMGPIFSEYLFIRFFTRPGEETGDQRYWSAAKFQELLMQLNYNGIVPDESKVDKSYKKWWVPVLEEVKIEKKKETGKQELKSTPTDNKTVSTTSPDVFISYQWGKQKQVLQLYRRLSSLGFTCWMDIFQMGGGDSLYDKIDRGVRGCRVLLSCVTSKYALSANCRREVSLGDALKKPIIPLLLEKITWPPSGPMSMVFTQLLYINFSKDEKVQEHWTGKEFDELMGQIEMKAPGLTPENSLERTGDKITPKARQEKDKTTDVSNSKDSLKGSDHESGSNEKALSEVPPQSMEGRNHEASDGNNKRSSGVRRETSKACILS